VKTQRAFERRYLGLGAVALLLLIMIALIGSPEASLAEPAPEGAAASALAVEGAEADTPPPEQALTAACPGGPVIDGITLDECHVENFVVGGNNRSITVWYTKNTVTATRTVKGVTRTMEHWINTDAQAQQVATWGREAWQRYHTIFGRDPYITGCGGNINVRCEEGWGWAGIAYWGRSGKCWIGIDSGTIRGGGGQWTTYHEFQHYLQYSYDSGCYACLEAGYSGNSEYVEGYADLASDAVDATVDIGGYSGRVQAYDPETSFFDKSYGNIYVKYYMEQCGVSWSAADPHHHMDAVRRHYQECDVQDDLYVLDTLIPTLTGGARTQKSLFVDFFAANWAKDWADPISQPKLVYTDDDGTPYGSIRLHKNEALTGGFIWNGELTPDDWAGLYYQGRPQAGCNFCSLRVDGAPGAELGITLMAADTTAPTSVRRSTWIGEDFSRTFVGNPVHDRVVAIVNAFDTTHTYDVRMMCITPTLNILEPKQTNFALVGAPASPISFLARFEVLDSTGAPVLGIPESMVSAKAGADACTLVAGSLQEVNGEYWMVVLPPTKPVGTTFVDFQVCLAGTVCDTETNGLLYVDPGNSDIALVFDGSGSMDIEDIAGEGKRLTNAKKAGEVVADLLRDDDRILVTSFSAFDNPAGCGLPTGTGNCALDLQTHMARTTVSLPGTIATTKSAINAITARDWTPIGAALKDAKNKLLATPTNSNPKHIILLSDGEENVNPLYADVRTEIKNSGVVVDTVGFGIKGSVGEPTLAQIAADTGGVFRFVPSKQGTSMALSSADLSAIETEGGIPHHIAQRLATSVLPGPLGLDDVYEFFEAKSQDAARLFQAFHVNVPQETWKTDVTFVGDNVTRLRLVSAGKQPDYGSCEGYHRDVQVQPPGYRYWIPISPPGIDPSPPPTWDIRNGIYDDVVIIPNPAQGVWRIRTMYQYWICADGARDLNASSQKAFETDFMMSGSVQSDARLQGRFLPPVRNNRCSAGETIPIAAVLLNRGGTIAGANVVATVARPEGTDWVSLQDDGNHGDGKASDGIYGGKYTKTTVGGVYNVRIVATWKDATSGEWESREWIGGVWVDGPEFDDRDKDGMPDEWERRCNLDTSRNDAQEDVDDDWLSNIVEFWHGTSPCNPDTDGGGEMDGSEVEFGRDPLDPSDDAVNPVGHVRLRPYNGALVVSWPRARDYSHMLLFVSDDPAETGDGQEIEPTGVFTLTRVINDRPYWVRLAGVRDGVQTALTPAGVVTPKADPDPPSGYVVINDDDEWTLSRDVLLALDATDVPLEGMADSSNSGLGNALSKEINVVSGDVEMRVANEPSFDGVEWEPLAYEKAWTLRTIPSQSPVHTVYAQFRDGVGNESMVTSDDILLESGLYLSPTQSTIAVSQTVRVDIMVANIEDLYGVQLNLGFDPDVVEVQDAYSFLPGIQIEEGDFLIPDEVPTNQADNAAGVIALTMSLQGDKPGVSGSGRLATITFHGVDRGETEVGFRQSVLSDPQSVAIPHGTRPADIKVQRAIGLVKGKIILERRASNAGSQVCLDARCAIVANDGSYSFNEVTPGNYTLGASHSSYLRSSRTIAVPIGTLNVPDVTLLGGDVNQDDKIALIDGSLIGMAWNSTPTSAHWDARCDITDDDQVNVLDLVAVQYNWAETAPGPWLAGAPRGGPAPAAVAATVVVSPSMATLQNAGDTVTCDILAQGVEDLYSAWIQVSFDPSVVRVVDNDPRPSNPGVQIMAGTLLNPIYQQELHNEADNTTGVIDYSVTLSHPAETVDGDGVLATITFEAVADGTSAIALDNIEFGDHTLPDPVVTTPSSQDGSIRVGAAADGGLYVPLVLKSW